MSKGFEPREIEDAIRADWQAAGVHVADPESAMPPFCMVIPPPNVTGVLHIGHALNMTVQDIVARWRRMCGDDVLWLPGTDHAGIATQAMVERSLAAEGLDRKQIGRQEFERRVWEWKENYGDRIVEQMQRLGLSCDWSRLRFTLDPGLSAAVRRVFVELFDADLIYRGEYLVNWCPSCDTAISDLEVKHREVDGTLWTLRYPIEVECDDADVAASVEVKTTRPETMLGDTALAVHPEDERHQRLIGRSATLPIIGRRLPVIADEFVDPDFGTGIVKVTPAHDPNDYLAGQKHRLSSVQVIDGRGRMTEAAGPYAGLDRLEAREQLLEHLQREGLLTGRQPHRHAVGHCDRCDTPVEPQVSTQWFVRMEALARPALEAVEQSDITFHPANQVKIYREWLTNIRDWCVSRQLWWGHRIPAWFCDACDITVVSEEEPGSCPECETPLRQDADVLDTWFSSALWPLSTLGWPEETTELRRYYPTQLLVTASDILFFWVARMIFMGLRFGGDVPFREVYFHGLVRDEQGVKMSKTRGNGVDPLELIEEFGTDAVRLTLAATFSPGGDMNFSRRRMAGYRTFCNKLWNAARFALLSLGDEEAARQAAAAAADPRPVTLADRWILSRTARLIPEVDHHLVSFRFDEACALLYQFTWHEFCDWYLEMSKLILQDDDHDLRASTRGTLLAVLEILLRALHPVMPFITEEIWGRLPEDRGLLALAPWAAVQTDWIDPEIERDIQLLQSVVTEARRLRAEVGVDPRQRTPLLLVVEAERARADLESVLPHIASLVRAEPIQIVDVTSSREGMVSGVCGAVEVLLPLEEGVIDLGKERTRLRASLDRIGTELGELDQRLQNRGFLDKAPAAVVTKAREREVELRAEHQRLGEQLEELGG